jgi:integrase
VAQITTRRTKSGEARYDVRVRIGNRVVNRTFTRRRDADAYARTVEADRLRGLAIDPRAGLVTFETYARRWVCQRPLRPLTRDLYDGLLRNHILPTFGKRAVGKVVPAEIRTWYAELGTKLAPATTTRVYRFLHSIFATAVEDELIMRNPCIVRGASTASSPERPTATIAEVDALVEAMDDQYRAMVILAAWCGLRLGELLALTRRRIDLDQGTVEVVASSYERFHGNVETGPPKTAAGRRRVSIPPHVLPEIERHLQRFVGSSPDSPLFVGPKGGVLYRGVFARCWRRARTAVGVEHLHFHDLRHTGNTLAATAGASTKELMVRMGHANPRAALIYQHATAERDKAIAGALSELAGRSRTPPLRLVSGTSDDNEEVPAATAEGSGPRDGRAMEGPERASEAPERASDLERTTGFEPATPTLARLCSTS